MLCGHAARKLSTRPGCAATWFGSRSWTGCYPALTTTAMRHGRTSRAALQPTNRNMGLTARPSDSGEAISTSREKPAPDQAPGKSPSPPSGIPLQELVGAEVSGLQVFVDTLRYEP